MKPEEIDLPPYLPDLPEIRKDMARYHDRITEMDAQVGKVLDDLEKAGLADTTIVIYCSDHGGILPRGKRYLEDTGVKVPFIVRVPEKFQNLSPFKPGERVTEPISFVDISATLLSLAGIEKPAQMQGRPFLGTKRVEPAADEMEFLYADRFVELYGMRRGLTDGKWKYIRNFNPDFPTAPYSFYQFGQPGWRAFQKAWQDGKLTGIHKELWEPPATSERLYDLSADPWETNNLAADPAHAEKLRQMRDRLRVTMKEIADTGLVPEPLFAELAKGETIAEYVQSAQFDINGVLDLAFTATTTNGSSRWNLIGAIHSEDAVKRHWGALGMMLLDTEGAHVDAFTPLLKDPVPVIRTTAAEALFRHGKKGHRRRSPRRRRHLGNEQPFPAQPTQQPPTPRFVRPPAGRLGEREEHGTRRRGLHPALHPADEGVNAPQRLQTPALSSHAPASNPCRDSGNVIVEWRRPGGKPQNYSDAFLGVAISGCFFFDYLSRTPTRQLRLFSYSHLRLCIELA